MSAMDFASALAGPGGGGPPPGGGPDVSALGVGGVPNDPGQPPDQGQGPDAGSGGGELFDNSMEALDVAEHALHAFIRLDPDDADRAAAAKLLQGVLQLKAGNQKSVQAGDMKSLSRALSGSQAFGG
jgi:hypothetical protein